MAQESTLVAVAARAGVSIASASRALNGGVASTATVARVRSAAEELGYRPHLMARGLRAGRTHQACMLVPDAANPVYARMMGTLQPELAAHGIRLLLQQATDDDLVTAVRELSTGLVDGAVVVILRVTEEILEAVRSAPVPVVVVGLVPDDSAIDSVRADSAAGMGLLVEHLLEQGVRRIALVNGPVDTTPGRLRLAGFQHALVEAGLSPDLVVHGEDFTRAAAAAAARRLLDQGVPDAVIGANDLLALATLRECATRGLRVPDDVLLAGMDDTDLAELSVPSLTSVDLGAEQRARLAARTLLRRIAGGAPGRPQLVPPRLHVRESTSRRPV